MTSYLLVISYIVSFTYSIHLKKKTVRLWYAALAFGGENIDWQSPWSVSGQMVCVSFWTYFPVSLQETQDPSAVVWLDEIQDAILKANQDTKEALQCKSTHSFNFTGPILYQRSWC